MDTYRITTILKSKTFWGAVTGTTAWLLAQPQITPVVIFQAVGTLLTAIGVRDAITKHE